MARGAGDAVEPGGPLCEPEQAHRTRRKRSASRASLRICVFDIADHLGWAVAVTASADHEVVDRRRIELIEPGLSAAPIHWQSRRLDVPATAALVEQVRASVVRATWAALDELATALPKPIVSISLRTWPPDFPSDIAVQRRAPYEARADAIMYRQVLAELAHERGWEVEFYTAKQVVDQAIDTLGARASRSCTVLGRGWDRRTTTIGWRSPRPSSAAKRSLAVPTRPLPTVAASRTWRARSARSRSTSWFSPKPSGKPLLRPAISPPSSTPRCREGRTRAAAPRAGRGGVRSRTG